MQEITVRQPNLALKELVAEAARALARLDTARLEELALSCQALNREVTALDRATLTLNNRRELVSQAREASGDMAVFARVLDATRSNIKVMQRLRELRAGRLEYREELSATYAGILSGTESQYGND